MTIGKGMIIKGRIHSEEDVFLNGEMEGDLNIENYRLTIGPDGKVAANARAREVDISGTLTGNVESTEKTCIRASGRLTGDVKTRGIVIEEGAFRCNQPHTELIGFVCHKCLSVISGQRSVVS